MQVKININATLTMIAILITGCFEASIFVGVGGLYLVALFAPAYVADTMTYKRRIKRK